MNIGILTFHEAPNPGAFFQALSTQKMLEALGHTCEFIHYSCPGTANRHPMRPYFRPRTYLDPKTYWALRTRIGITRKILAFNKAVRQHFHASPACRTAEDIARLHYDAVVVGSDMVWDYVTFPLARNPVYFGHGLSADRLIALAPCCGNVDPEGAIPDFVTTGLPRFDDFSARDANTQRLVQRVCGEAPPILPDPAFALDVSDLATERLIEEPYLFIYQAGRLEGEMATAVQAFARERGLRTVAACYRQPAAQINRPGAGPMEWLSLIRHADAVLTDCFHGVVFSMILERPFAVNESQVQRPKIRDVVKRTGMSSRLISSAPHFFSVIKGTPESFFRNDVQLWVNTVTQYLSDSLE